MDHLETRGSIFQHGLVFRKKMTSILMKEAKYPDNQIKRKRNKDHSGSEIADRPQYKRENII